MVICPGFVPVFVAAPYGSPLLSTAITEGLPSAIASPPTPASPICRAAVSFRSLQNSGSQVRATGQPSRV